MNTSTDDAIAIIGGGASAVLLLAHFALQDHAPPREIRVFDRSGIFGPGVAYGTAQDAHLLNIRAENMSAFHTDPTHFSGWAAGRGYGAQDFVPRRVYGAYLSAVLEDAVRRAEAQGHKIIFTSANVLSSKHEGSQYVLQTTAGIFTARRVILASGNATPVAVPGAENFSAADGYYADPWKADYQKISGLSHVVLAGTGLSMVDAVLSLQQAGFKGAITGISRRGLLPAVHGTPHVYTLPENFRRPVSALEWMRFLRAHAAQVEAQGGTWQSAMDSFRPYTNDIWRQLPAAEQQKFLRKFLPFWNIHRHRMAPQIGAIIHGLRDSGRLSIAKSSIESIVKTAPGLLTVRGPRKSWQADAVINCLGYHYRPAPDAVLESSHIIGPPLWGRSIETTAIPEIRAQAADIAASLADNR